MSEPLYNIHLRSLISGKSRVGVSRVTYALGQVPDPEPGIENPAEHAAELMGW